MRLYSILLNVSMCRECSPKVYSMAISVLRAPFCGILGKIGELTSMLVSRPPLAGCDLSPAPWLASSSRVISEAKSVPYFNPKIRSDYTIARVGTRIAPILHTHVT